MFEPHEICLDIKTVLKLPMLEGMYFKLTPPTPYVLTARIARPKLPKDVFEYRSAQARSPAIEEFIFDENNRLVGRRVPFQTSLSGIPEHAGSVGNIDFLSVWVWRRWIRV